MVPGCVGVGGVGSIRLISLEIWQGAGHAKAHLLAGLPIIPKKRRVNERLSEQKSVKRRIPNLPKSLADPVSPCSLILCIFQREQLEVEAHLWRCLGEHGEFAQVKELR